MNSSSEHNIPWELIISSFQKESSAGEGALLQQWLSASDENREIFGRVNRIWVEELNDYSIYQAANEEAAWKALRPKLENDMQIGDENGKVLEGNFRARRINRFRWASVAAVLVLVTGTLIWYKARNKGEIYHTGQNEERSIVLTDGSLIRLYADSKIEVSRNYNEQAREVTFLEGQASFDVKHDDRRPFIVDLGTTSVKDIGTSFYIHYTKDSVRLFVSSGEVAFTDKQTNQTKNLSAGMNLKYLPPRDNASASVLVDSADTIKNRLHFEDIDLRSAVLRLQEVYSKKLVLADSAIARKRISADLEGQSFEQALEVVCRALNIKYSKENDVYYLKRQ